MKENVYRMTVVGLLSLMVIVLLLILQTARYDYLEGFGSFRIDKITKKACKWNIVTRKCVFTWGEGPSQAPEDGGKP